MLKESSTELRAELEKVEKDLNGIFEGKNFMKLLMALAENQRSMSRAIKKLKDSKFDVVLTRSK